MAYARTPEALADIRRRTISATGREPNGRKQRPTTIQGREQAREAKDAMTETEALSTALAQPHRRGLASARLNPTLGARDPKAGYPLGVLYLNGTLTIDQHNAGERYAELYLRYAFHVTGHLPKFPCQAINDVAGGISTAREMSFEDAAKLKAQWHEAQTALADAGEWQPCASALVSVCVMAREPRHSGEMGALRTALNALHRCWK